MHGTRRKVAEIIAATENIPILAENMIPVDKSPKEAIEAELDGCDCYIGIFYKKWGSIPKKDNPEKLSVTAMEYKRAKKNNIPRLILISKEKKEKKLQKFIDEISDYDKGDWRKEYKDHEELLRLVTRGVYELTNAVRSRVKKVAVGTEGRHVYSLGTYTDKIEDVKVEEVMFFIEKTTSTNRHIRLSAWEDLEMLARGKRLWKHDAIWDVLSNQISSENPGEYINEALFVLKGMLFTNLHERNEEVVTRVRNNFQFELEQMLGPGEKAWTKSRSDIKQILECIVEGEGLFQIFWNGWERAARNLEDDDQYEKAIAPFVNDLAKADANVKSRFRIKLYDLIDSHDEKISRRAMAMR
jgi:hypothetical protein